jgi:molecular chaperone GrpE (heat shock protein)
MSAHPVTPLSTAVVAGPLAPTPQQDAVVQQQLAQHDLRTLPLKDIAVLGGDAERALHQTLDSFLSHIDRFESGRLFNLFDALREDVDREDLPALADRILHSPPTAWQRLVGLFNRKAVARAAASAWEETRRVAAGKTRTLTDKVQKLEGELAQEQRRLEQEMQRLEQLKEAYRERFEDFVTATAFLKALAVRSQGELAAMEAAASPTDARAQFALEEARHKLQALQSRALAVEATLTRLPTDQLVIRQLQNAGLATWQETTTTASARFASIKMTLLTLHGTLMTQGVQKLAEQGRSLDENLAAVRGQLLRDVVTTSANMPGDNRLAQAQQLQQVVAESRALQGIVTQARSANAVKFEQARVLLAQAQNDIVALGREVRPDLPPRT